MGRTAVLTGATGEMGKNILPLLLKAEEYEKVYILGRKTIKKIEGHTKLEKIIIDFEKMNFNTDILENADVFSALGTGSAIGDGKKYDFETVDYRYPLKLAKLCQGKARSFNIVSAMGANSRTSYRYLKIKGEMEDEISKLGLKQVRFYRPSMLIAPERENLSLSENIMIKVFQVISPVLVGKLHNWKGIKPNVVAEVMVSNAIKDNKMEVYKYKEMVTL